MRYKVGDIAYIIESNRFIREVKIARCSGDMYLVKFTDSKGGIQVRESRIHEKESDAQAELDKYNRKTSNTPVYRKNQYDYMMEHKL